MSCDILKALLERRTLVEQAGAVCISIYMPTYRLGLETQQALVRFKNLIHQAQESILSTSLWANSFWV